MNSIRNLIKKFLANRTMNSYCDNKSWPVFDVREIIIYYSSYKINVSIRREVGMFYIRFLPGTIAYSEKYEYLFSPPSRSTTEHDCVGTCVG